MPSIRHTIPFLALTGALVAACSDSGLPDDEAHLGTSESALCGISIDIKKSLIVHRADTANGSATILDAFPFKAVMDQLVASAAATNTSTSLYQNAMRIAEPSTTPGTSGAFHCDTASVDPNNWGYECPRQGDADLGDVDPFAPAVLTVGSFHAGTARQNSPCKSSRYRSESAEAGAFFARMGSSEITFSADIGGFSHARRIFATAQRVTFRAPPRAFSA